MAGDMEMEEITQTENKENDYMEKETAEEDEKTETSVYQALTHPGENTYSMVAQSNIYSKYHKGNGRARLYWRITVFLSLLCLILLAVILALAVKLNEVQSGQPCPKRLVDVVCPTTPQPCSLQVCQDMYPSLTFNTNEHQCCGKGWLKLENSCYYMSNERLSWQKSRDECQKMGGDLVVIENDRQQKFLTEKGDMLYWIGLSYLQRQKWMWINNNTLTQNYWAVGHQQYGYCAFLNGRVSPLNNWYPSSCEVFSHYICQKD